MLLRPDNKAFVALSPEDKDVVKIAILRYEHNPDKGRTKVSPAKIVIFLQSSKFILPETYHAAYFVIIVLRVWQKTIIFASPIVYLQSI